MKNLFLRTLTLGVGLSLSFSPSAQAAPVGENSGLESMADGALIGLPLAALGLTFMLTAEDTGSSEKDAKASYAASPGSYSLLHMNGSPRHDLGLALLRTELITHGLKAVVNEPRPNGESSSFPSGHTATTFAAAEFVRKEYGWGWAAPAYLAASFTGWSRVETQDHWWQDVAAGAAIGILSNHDFGEMRGWTIRPTMLSFRARRGAQEEWGVAPGITMELPIGK